MSYTEQEKQYALALYDKTGSIAKVINTLGYPSIQGSKTGILKKRKERTPTIQINLSTEDIHHWN